MLRASIPRTAIEDLRRVPAAIREAFRRQFEDEIGPALVDDMRTRVPIGETLELYNSIEFLVESSRTLRVGPGVASGNAPPYWRVQEVDSTTIYGRNWFPFGREGGARLAVHIDGKLVAAPRSVTVRGVQYIENTATANEERMVVNIDRAIAEAGRGGA